MRHRIRTAVIGAVMAAAWCAGDRVGSRVDAKRMVHICLRMPLKPQVTVVLPLQTEQLGNAWCRHPQR